MQQATGGKLSKLMWASCFILALLLSGMGVPSNTKSVAAHPMVSPVAVAQLPQGFPADFPVPIDTSTGEPLGGFGGGEGTLNHYPIIFIHGNNETALYWRGLSRLIPLLLDLAAGRLPQERFEPIPGGGPVRAIDVFQAFLDAGYTPRELWALSYLGPDGTNGDTVAIDVNNSHVPNAQDVGNFVNAVLAYAGAEKVDIIAHSLGATVTREWIRSSLDKGENVLGKLDDLVLIAGPNHGVHFCGPPFVTEMEPDRTVCEEIGCADSSFLMALNAEETPRRADGGPDYLTIFAAGASEDWVFPAEGVDCRGRMLNLRLSPVLDDAFNVGLAFTLPPDARFPLVIFRLEFGDPRAHYLVGASEPAFRVMFPFVSNLRR